MKTTINYRVAVNKNSEIYSHFEFCGENLEFAKNQLSKIYKEISETDEVELQKEINYSGVWEKVEI